MAGIQIFHEGKADEKFLKDIINKFFPLKINDVAFIEMHGYTGFRSVQRNFQLNSDGINLVFLDADYPKNNGGFQERLEYVYKQKEDLKIDFEIFLFPNHRENGDLEALLASIINSANIGLLHCWNNYIDCLYAHAKSQGKNINIPDEKNKFYTYIHILDGSSNAKETDRNYLNQDHWDLDSGALKPLIEFLIPHF
jgi:hypothetical protein